MSEADQIKKLVPGEPHGDPHQIRAAANTWRSVAQQLASVRDDLDRHVQTVAGVWTGTGAQAFMDQWQGQKGLKPAIDSTTDNDTSKDNIAKLAASLDTLADQIEAAQNRYNAALIATGITVAVGIGLTLVSFGASDAVAGGAAVAEVGAAAMVAEEAATAATSVFSMIGSFAAQLAVRMTINFVVNFTVDMDSQMAANAIVYPDHNPLNHLDSKQAGEDALSATLAMELTPGLAKLPLISKLPPKLARVAVPGATSAGIDAAQQELTTGHIDPEQALFAGGIGAASAAIADRLGRRGGVGNGPRADGVGDAAEPTLGRLPGDAAAAFQSRFPKVDNSPGSMTALTEIFTRTKSGGRDVAPRAGEYLPTRTSGAAPELRTIVEQSRRPDVERIEVVPASPRQRTCDLIVHAREPDGSVLPTRVEIRTLTGARPGYMPRGDTRRDYSVSDIVGAIRDKALPRGKPSQLAVPMGNVPPGGTLALHLRGARAQALAKVNAAMTSVSPALQGASHVHTIEFYSRGGPPIRYRRGPAGTYTQDP